MTRLASYTTPSGVVVDLHRDGQRMWTCQRDDDTGTSDVPVGTLLAAEQYEYALDAGHVEGPFPFGLSMVA